MRHLMCFMQTLVVIELPVGAKAQSGGFVCRKQLWQLRDPKHEHRHLPARSPEPRS